MVEVDSQSAFIRQYVGTSSRARNVFLTIRVVVEHYLDHRLENGNVTYYVTDVIFVFYNNSHHER